MPGAAYRDLWIGWLEVFSLCLPHFLYRIVSDLSVPFILLFFLKNKAKNC